jgi:cyclophilin family peptidyl-prolyl cis-trans isomerase
MLRTTSPFRTLALLALVAAAALTGACERNAPGASTATEGKASTTPATPAPSAPAQLNPKVPVGAKSSGGRFAVIETNKGTIEIEFLADAAPKAVENFRLLAEHGYYDGLTFHRVVKDFMIQGGDPLGDGRGGMSAWGGTFEDEIQRTSPLYRAGYKRGIVAMANRGPNTNTSQFFIMHQDYRLPPDYVIFGRVSRGMEVIDAMADVPKRLGADRDLSAPITPLVMQKVTIKK